MAGFAHAGLLWQKLYTVYWYLSLPLPLHLQQFCSHGGRSMCLWAEILCSTGAVSFGPGEMKSIKRTYIGMYCTVIADRMYLFIIVGVSRYIAILVAPDGKGEPCAWTRDLVTYNFYRLSAMASRYSFSVLMILTRIWLCIATFLGLNVYIYM